MESSSSHHYSAADCPVIPGFEFSAGQDFASGTNLMCNEAASISAVDLGGVCLGFEGCTSFSLYQGAGDATVMSCLKSGNVTLAPDAANMAGPCQGTYVLASEAWRWHQVFLHG